MAEWSKTRRRHLWRKGKRKCHYCGTKLTLRVGPPGTLTADHKNPRSKGGGNKRKNLLPACYSCNQKKRSKTYEEFVALIAGERTPDGRLYLDRRP